HKLHKLPPGRPAAELVQLVTDPFARRPPTALASQLTAGRAGPTRRARRLAGIERAPHGEARGTAVAMFAAVCVRLAYSPVPVRSCSPWWLPAAPRPVRT